MAENIIPSKQLSNSSKDSKPNPIQSLADNQINSNKDESESKEEDELDPAKAINLLFGILLELYGKRQYKKLLKLINEQKDKEEEFKKQFNFWKITFVKIITIQKIIENKIIKRYRNRNMPKLDEYLLKENQELYKWILFTYENDDKMKFVITFNEMSIQFLLQKCINLSKFCIYYEKIKDAIAFLTIGLRLIMNTQEFFISPDSLSLSGEILLQLSSLLIAESNFETAQNCISILIKFLYLSLETKLYNNNISFTLFNLKQYPEEELKIITKILFHMSIAFYQLGVCYENKNDDYNAFYAYKTSKWFSVLISYDKNTNMYTDLLNEINIRQLMRNRIIIFFERCVKKEELQDEDDEDQRKKFNNKLFMDEEKRKKKYGKIITYIEKLRLKDVDDEDPDLFNKVGHKPLKNNVIKSTKQIHLLNYLMSDYFKGMIKDMKKIEINKLDKDMINAIEKKIINFKNNERHKTAKKLDKQKSKKQLSLYNKKYILNTSKLSETKTYRIKSAYNAYYIPLTERKKKRPESVNKSSKNRLYTDNSISNNNKYNINNTESFYSINTRPNTASVYNKSLNKNNFSKNKFLNSQLYNPVYKKKKSRNAIKNLSVKEYQNKSVDYNKILKEHLAIYKQNREDVKKYNYNEYFFNKDYIKKLNFLEKQYDRELDFQKQLLKTKFNKEEVNEKIPDVDIRNVNKKCENIYYSTFLNELMNVKEAQVIFDKAEISNNFKQSKKNKKEDKNYFSSTQKKEYKESSKIRDINEGYINDITNSIMKINSEEKKVNKKIRKFTK